MKKCFAALALLGLLSVVPAQAQVYAPIPKLLNGLSTTVATIKASAGVLNSIQCYNPNASVAYVQVFDVSGSVTLGTTTPTLSLGMPASGQITFPMPSNFQNAIKIAATTTATGNTAPGTALDCNATFS